MKLKLIALVFLSGSLLVRGQGTFVYDQRDDTGIDGSLALNQTPFGQSFTPTLDSIGFVELQLVDNNNSASTIAVNVRSGSITGSVLGTSQPITVTGISLGTYDFLFSNPVALIPGTKYWFEPVVVSGLAPGAEATTVPYAGGNVIVNGTDRPMQNLWFREGIITSVPEPSSVALLLVGGVLYWHRRQQCIA